jgi:hypothetical protein
MFKAFLALNRLSRAEREAIDAKEVSGSYPASMLLDKLRALSEFDRLADHWRARAMIALPLMIFALIVLGILTAAGGHWMLVPAGVLFVVCLVVGFGLFELHHLDISNNVRGVALPFLAIVKQDVEPAQRIRVRVDLTSPTAKRKQIETLPTYARGAYHKVVDTLFADPWFEGSARFADGTVLRWRVQDEVRQSQRTKRNARGKDKTKTRHYKRSEISVVVSLPTKRYTVSDLDAPGQTVAIQRGPRRCTIKFKRKVKVKSLEPIDPRLLIDTISMAYRSATPVRSAG